MKIFTNTTRTDLKGGDFLKVNKRLALTIISIFCRATVDIKVEEVRIMSEVKVELPMIKEVDLPAALMLEKM